MCVHACVHVCSCEPKEASRVSDPLELELQVIVMPDVSAGNHTRGPLQEQQAFGEAELSGAPSVKTVEKPCVINNLV